MNMTVKPAGLVLLALAIPVIANVVLMCVVWQAARQAHHDAATVAAVERLVEQSGLLRSTELSSIRFRLRFPGGHDVPMAGPHARLASRADDDWKHIGTVVMTRTGTIDFGFHPAGSYRLTLKTDDGMSLEHVFEVRRGSHHDRLIICPMRTSQDARLQIVVNWPHEQMPEDMIAVCRIEPAAFVEGEWTWRPNENWWPVHAVVAQAGETSSDIRLTRIREVSDIFATCAADLQPADKVILPYRYSRLSEITFLSPRAENGENRVVSWGTLRFRAPHDDAHRPCTLTPQWQADVPAPEFDSLGNPAGPWVIELPERVVDRLQKRMHETSELRAWSAEAGAADRFDVTVVRATTSAEHVDLAAIVEQIAIVGSQLFGIARIELLGFIEFGVAAVRGVGPQAADSRQRRI